MISVSDKLKMQFIKISQWNDEAIEAWKDVPDEERNIISNYMGIFLDRLKDEPFSSRDKKILRKHAKKFIKFLKKVD